MTRAECQSCGGSGKHVIWGSTYESNCGVDFDCSACGGTGKQGGLLKTQGRRRDDQDPSSLPKDIVPGDYWKVTRPDGSVYWHIAVPLGRGDEAYALGNLINHTVREHEDGTISVRPGDGSSNSILVSRGQESWHGYVDHGVLEEC